MDAVQSPLGVHHPDITEGEHDYTWPLNAYSVALAKSLVVKSGRGKLYGFTVYSHNAGSQFIQLFDVGAVPGNGALPVLVFPIATESTVFVGYADVGRSFDRGIVLANSTTGASLTLGAADCWFDAQYV